MDSFLKIVSTKNITSEAEKSNFFLRLVLKRFFTYLTQSSQKLSISENFKVCHFCINSKILARENKHTIFALVSFSYSDSGCTVIVLYSVRSATPSDASFHRASEEAEGF